MSTPPTAKEFNLMGRGNAMDNCIMKVEVTDYNLPMWTTLSGVNSDDPSTSDALIKESFDLMLDYHYNCYAWDITATSTGNDTSTYGGGPIVWNETVSEMVLKANTYNSNGGVDLNRGNDATFPSLPHYRQCRSGGIQDSSGNYIAGGADNFFLTQEQQIRVQGGNGSPCAIYYNDDLMGYSFYQTHLFPLIFIGTGRIASAKSDMHIRFLQNSYATSQRNNGLGDEYSNDFAVIGDMHCICAIRSNDSDATPSGFSNRDWDFEELSVSCDYSRSGDEDGNGIRNQTSSVQINSIVKYEY